MGDFKLTWEETLSADYRLSSSISDFFEIVKATGYPFFEWNGLIYRVFDNTFEPMMVSRQMTTDDLE